MSSKKHILAIVVGVLILAASVVAAYFLSSNESGQTAVRNVCVELDTQMTPYYSDNSVAIFFDDRWQEGGVCVYLDYFGNKVGFETFDEICARAGGDPSGGLHLKPGREGLAHITMQAMATCVFR